MTKVPRLLLAPMEGLLDHHLRAVLTEVGGLDRCVSEFIRVTGFDLRHEWRPDMADLENQGLGRVCPDRFQLTDRGLRLADLAAERFLRPA